MSCNGCRVLRKGCSDSCLLRASLHCIDSAEAQGHATLFVAKFFGRAGLLSFINNVPPSQRPALFQSLLFEAAGRTINPISGAAGLLWTNNWHLVQLAVETVLNGGSLRPLPQSPESPDTAALYSRPNFSISGPKRPLPEPPQLAPAACDLDLCLTPRSPSFEREEKRLRRPTTPSMNSEGSVTTSRDSNEEPRLLSLFI